MNINNYFTQIFKLINQKRSFVVVTLASIKGSAPQNAGSQMIVDTSGLMEGTIGGGALEFHVLKKCQELLISKEHKNSQTILEKINLQKDIAMTCGGEVNILYQHYNFNKFKIIMFGAGHVSHATIKILRTLDNAQIVVCDDRQEWIDKIPNCDNVLKICSMDILSIINKYLCDNSYVLVMTKGHITDLPILIQIFNKIKNEKLNLNYLGVIGSKSKRRNLEKALLQHQISPELYSILHCPLGNKIGSNSPAEIAISIAAELLQVRDTKPIT